MPPKKDKKPKRKVRKVKKVIKPKIEPGSYGSLVKSIEGLRGSLMRSNIPMPGAMNFTPFLADQQINQIRAQANNTIQKAISETNTRLRDAGNETLSRISKLIPEDYPGEKVSVYEPMIEAFGGPTKQFEKSAKARAKVIKELQETVPEGGLAQAGISMQTPGQPFGPDRPSPFELLEQQRKEQRKAKKEPIFLET